MTHVLAVAVRSTRNVMEQALELIQLMQDMVLYPDWQGAAALFLVSLINEIFALFPYAIVVAGQLLFLDDPLTLTLIGKLIFLVSIPIGIGSAIGSLVVYVLTYFGGKPLIVKFHKYLHFSWHDVERINTRFKGAWYDEIVFVLLRSIPVLPSLPVSIAAGILRMRFWPYFLLSTIGFTIRMILTIMIFGLGLSKLSQFLIFLYTN